MPMIQIQVSKADQDTAVILLNMPLGEEKQKLKQGMPLEKTQKLISIDLQGAATISGKPPLEGKEANVLEEKYADGAAK